MLTEEERSELKNYGFKLDELGEWIIDLKRTTIGTGFLSRIITVICEELSIHPSTRALSLCNFLHGEL